MRIIYFDIDTLRLDHLGCYGYFRKTSPNMDQIAHDGTIFTEAYQSNAPCLPSRASFFTGQFGIHTGIIGHGGTTADFPILGKERDFTDQRFNDFLINKLRQLGYYTVSISPFAERHSAYWFCAGWNEIYNPGKQGLETADDIYPYAMKWLNQHKDSDNWFLHINLWDPHTPYRTLESFEDLFNDKFIPDWITEEIIETHRKSYGPHSAREIHGYKDHKTLMKFFPRIKSSEIKDLDDFRDWINAYDAGILYSDNFIGKIITFLKKAEIFQAYFKEIC